MYKVLLYLLLISTSCIVVSCQNKYFNLNNNQNIEVWKVHQERLSQIVNYQIKGVLVCFVSNEKKIHMRFFFQKVSHKYYRLVFNDFIGFTNIEFNISENGICPTNIINNSIKNCISWNNFEFAIKKAIGINIPFCDFKAWILGLPGTTNNFNLNINGVLQTVYYKYNDHSFIVLYKDYFYKEKLILPSIIEIFYDDCYCFKIKIYDWIIS